MNYIQILCDAAGASHILEDTWPLTQKSFTPPSPAGYSVTATMRASGVLMMHHPAGYRDDWHCAPVPVLGTVLSGRVRIETSDGDARLLSPGDQFVAADLIGAGHRMQEVDGGAYDLALVLLDDMPEGVAGGPQR